MNSDACLNYRIVCHKVSGYMRSQCQYICNPCQISAISYFGQEPALAPIMPRQQMLLVKQTIVLNLLLL